MLKNDYLKKFDKEYPNIDTMLKYNYENINDTQKARFIDDLSRILENIKESNTIYRSDFKTLQIMLKDIQFYEFLRKEDM